jgi:hypothetical protein
LQGLSGPPLPRERDCIEKYGTTFFVGVFVFAFIFITYYAPEHIQPWMQLAQDLHETYFPPAPPSPVLFPTHEIILPSAEEMGLNITVPVPTPEAEFDKAHSRG